jgi:CDP-glucose 4,6-dehydratase
MEAVDVNAGANAGVSACANAAFWCGKRVFITGHTGFKGGWLALWLKQLGAELHGYALAPPTEPNLFTVARLEGLFSTHTVADVRDAAALRNALHTAQPQLVFHLAAQPLVRASYAEPVDTYAVNVMGSVNLLEAVRGCDAVRAVVNVTTDKCYRNREVPTAYRETDALGGHDPYSNSKACAELVTAAYRDSFLAARNVAVATARAGNVIGGGDWATDRLLPDFFRAHAQGRPLEVRHPDAVRPWQHVLEPLGGYLMLAQRLATDGAAFASAWNFGPSQADATPVHAVLDALTTHVPGASWCAVGNSAVHEAHLLSLDSAKARAQLGWRPRWTLDEALARTAEWHAARWAGADMAAVCSAQIGAYEAAAVAVDASTAA